MQIYFLCVVTGKIIWMLNDYLKGCIFKLCLSAHAHTCVCVPRTRGPLETEVQVVLSNLTWVLKVLWRQRFR